MPSFSEPDDWTARGRDALSRYAEPLLRAVAARLVRPRTNQPVEELLARKKLAQEVAGRLSDRVLLVRPGRVDAVLDELRKMGHTPQVVGKSSERTSA